MDFGINLDLLNAGMVSFMTRSVNKGGVFMLKSIGWFDLISDVHLDFWIFVKNVSREGQEENIRGFVNMLIPEVPSKVLVIAGDLGHKNDQNFVFLQILKETYEYILIVPGNHDYYLINSTARYKHNNLSSMRWKDMKQLGATLPGIHFLEGTTITIDGTTFGGTGMWYDFSYGMQVLGKTDGEMMSYWREEMRDAKYIRGAQTRPQKWAEEECKLLEQVLETSDVIITHIGPDWSDLTSKQVDDMGTGFYYFDGRKYLEKCEGKVWCYGHVHHNSDYTVSGCRLVNNALGYPNEKADIGKIVTIEL